MKIISLNLNGIRAAEKKGLTDWIKNSDADMFCFQETRASLEQINSVLKELEDYYLFCNIAEKKGYSGTAILTKIKPIKIYYDMPLLKNINEGRTVICEYDNFILINLYTPNGGIRLDFKLDFVDKFLIDIINFIKDKKQIIICTDFNIAHTELDLSNPQVCKNISGYLPVERELFNNYLKAGLFDTYREINPTAQAFTWSSYTAKAANNKWGYLYRFDYIFVTKQLMEKVSAAHILYDNNLSDHYAVTVEIDL